MALIFPSRLSLCLALVFLLPFTAQARIGDKLEEAKQTDFFKFFNLKEVSRDSAKPYSHATFKPGAGNFRELVSVRVTLDAGERIRGMQVELARSFVDHPMNGIFARDIAKSLLRSAVPTEDERAINDLANEIEFPQDQSGYGTPRPGANPQLPAQPTPGYLTYLGQRRSFQQTLSRSVVSLDNVKSDGVDKLIVSVNSRDLR